MTLVRAAKSRLEVFASFATYQWTAQQLSSASELNGPTSTRSSTAAKTVLGKCQE
jgi:hypothetical protein